MFIKGLMLDRMTAVDFYSVLGTARDASYQELKSCYQKAVLECHPDKLPQMCSDAERAAAMQRFCAVDAAWRTLGSDDSRRAYDAQLADREFSKPLPMNEKVHIDDMDWQEDEEVYTYSCRCGGEYVASDKDIDQRTFIISCNTCTLSIQLIMDGDITQPT